MIKVAVEILPRQAPTWWIAEVDEKGNIVEKLKGPFSDVEPAKTHLRAVKAKVNVDGLRVRKTSLGQEEKQPF